MIDAIMLQAMDGSPSAHTLTGERPLPPERVHGKFERVELYTHEFVKMSQVRGDRNPISEELKKSIEELDVLNSIDCAHVSPETLREYIDFVNFVWGAKTDIADFQDQQRPDGSYYLVIAGHTRHEMVAELEAEDRIDVYPMEAKVHHVSSPQQIIDIQLAENIHGQPARERRAIAIVESYEWGVLNGTWSNQKEFLEANNAIGKSVLSEALAFANIPPRIREFVQSRTVSYNAGIEIGKAAGDLMDYLYFKAGVNKRDATPEQIKKIEELHDIELTIEVDKVIDAKLNSTAAEKRMRGWRARMSREMIGDESEREAAQDQAMFELDMFTPDEILDEDIRTAKSRLSQFLAKFGKTPSTAALELIQLHRGIIPDSLIQQLTEDNLHAVERANRLLAEKGLQQTTTRA